MKLGEIYRFEIGYQGRRASTWLYFGALLGITLQISTEAYIGKARGGGYLFNGPFIVTELALIGTVMGLLAAAALAGEAGARDVHSRMHPLFYTAPVSRGAYLGGRFLAAFSIHALVVLAPVLASLVVGLLASPEPDVIGPFRPVVYLAAYLFVALPNAFVSAALLFAMAALGRRAMAGYLGAVFLFAASLVSWALVAAKMGQWDLAKLLDPLGLTALAELSRTWTPVEKSTRLIGPQGWFLAGRLVWLALALGVLALTRRRFRFAHHVAGGWPGRVPRPDDSHTPVAAPSRGRVRLPIPRARRTLGTATHVRQAGAVAMQSFRDIVTSWSGIALAALFVALALSAPAALEHMGVPRFPTTGELTSFLTASGDVFSMIVPLLTVYYAGELVWRERDAGLGEIADAAPVPEWVSIAGKLAGLALVLAALQVLLIVTGMVVQRLQGYHAHEPWVFVRILLGIRLADHLLFAVLALAVHALVNHKYVGHGVVLVAFAFTAFASALGIEHNMLVWGADPGWSHSDLRGFGPYLGPWGWFKLYWGAWALLLAIVARLLWVRGREPGLGMRLRLARRRFTRPAFAAAATAIGLVLGLGGFVFYNTNVLHEHRTAADGAERRAEYERRYGRYAGAPQPLLTGTSLSVEIYPARRVVEIRGTHHLVNATRTAIDSVHVATTSTVETTAIGFDRPATRVLADGALGHRIYRLARPLEPGDSLRLTFEARFDPRGFPNGAVDAAVAERATFFRHHDWVPAVGYQTDRELDGAGDRRAHGLPARPVLPPPGDSAARHDVAGAERIAVETVVGTDSGQLAVAPGRLRRTWTAGGRRYFHYVTDAPIRNDYALYSADYAVRTGSWRGVAIEVVHHPAHAWNADRMLRGAAASLEYLTARLGPYPHGQLRFVEQPGDGVTLHAAPVNISYQEGFAILDPSKDERGIDLAFAVVAHEVAHHWWGNTLTPAAVAGAPLLSESLAWYSALGIVEHTHGPEHLRRLLAMLREAYLVPHQRAGKPLLRADDWLLSYRKGQFAMYALREYVGEARVDSALRRLIGRHGAGVPPLPTSLDLYGELRAVTPDSLRPLLADLFERNTYWMLATSRATAEPAAGGTWRVTLDVRARKVVVDSAGGERAVPMDDLVEIGVYGDAPADGGLGEPLYLRLHRVRAGEHRITVTVPRRPSRAGIDPRSLLIDENAGDNVVGVRN